MDRNKRRVTYVTGANSTLNGYGMNNNKKKKSGKIAQTLRKLLAAAALAAIIALVIGYALTGTGREALGRVTRIGATLQLKHRASHLLLTVLKHGKRHVRKRNGAPATRGCRIKLTCAVLAHAPLCGA
jgi:hypothetical protein